MGRLWRRAAGALKDRKSILGARLARRTAYRHPRVESTVIKATSHDEMHVDYSAVRVVFRLINTSPVCFRAFLWALSNRMDRTRSWAVALKGVILMHGALTCKTDDVKTIGRLPFDLSNFRDGHGNPKKMWGFNVFVRTYFAFVDQKSALMFADYQEEHNGKAKYMRSRAENLEREGCGGGSMLLQRRLILVQRLQGLLDMLLQIRAETKGMRKEVLILEAMNCIITEIYGIYSRICNGIAQLRRSLHIICSSTGAGRTEALMALQILRKSREQGEELSMYVHHFKEMKKLDNALKCLRVEQVPLLQEDYFWEVERMLISGGVALLSTDHQTDHMAVCCNSVVAVKKEEDRLDPEGESKRITLKTLITNEWEVFDHEEDLIKFSGEIGCVDDDDHMAGGENSKWYTGDNDQVLVDPFAASNLVPVPFQAYVKNQQLLPDLISFL